MKTNKTHHKVVLALFLITVTIVLAACYTPAPTAAPTAKPTEKPTAVPTVAPTVAPAKTYTYQDMVVGFIQTGSEGGWRAANTASFKETAEQLGIN